MSTTHPDADPAVPHGAGDHSGGHGHDDHAHTSEPLGPLDRQAWGAGVLGILLGAVVAAGLYVAAGGI
jgi:hypothetical protein